MWKIFYLPTPDFHTQNPLIQTISLFSLLFGFKFSKKIKIINFALFFSHFGRVCVFSSEVREREGERGEADKWEKKSDSLRKGCRCRIVKKTSPKGKNLQSLFFLDFWVWTEKREFGIDVIFNLKSRISRERDDQSKRK